MLRRLTIAGFKSILKADIQFGRVNLFIGGNGSGKSNLLEALGILSACLKDLSEVELQRRGVRLSVPTLFKSAFDGVTLRPTFVLKAQFENNVRYDVSLKAGAHSDSLRFFTEKVVHRATMFMGRGQNGVTVRGRSASKKDIDPGRGLWDRLRESFDDGELPDALTRELDRMARFAIYAPQTAFLRDTEREAMPVRPLGLQGGNLGPVIKRLLTTAFKPPHGHLADKIFDLVWLPGWTTAVRVKPKDPEVVSSQVRTSDDVIYFVDGFMNKKRNVVSAYDASEGTLYLLFLVALAILPDAPKIFALDNVDNALNPAMTTKMLETLIQATCDPEFRDAGIGPDQVFLTSHNPTSLDAFDLFDDQQRIFVVSRGEDGSTMVTPLEPPKGMSRDDWLKKFGGRKLSELWIEGLIPGALGL